MTPGVVPAVLGRDLGIVEAIGELPAVVVDAVVVLTQLGDPWLLLVATGAFYLFGPDRRRGALAVALAIGALAAVVALKHLFALPRPPPAARQAAADGFGFPSGHALGSTVVWGGLAILADVWTRRRRVLVAAALVGVVSLTRVVLRVHYVGDVVAGMAAGLVVLGGTLKIARGDPARAFAVAVGIALAAVGTGGGIDAVAAVGVTVGAGLAWIWLDPDGRTVAPAVGVAGIALFGGLWAAATAGEPGPPVVLAANLLAGGGIVALPRLSDAVEGRLPRRLRELG